MPSIGWPVKVCNAYPGDEMFHVEMGGKSIMTGSPLSYKEIMRFPKGLQITCFWTVQRFCDSEAVQ